MSCLLFNTLVEVIFIDASDIEVSFGVCQMVSYITIMSGVVTGQQSAHPATPISHAHCVRGETLETSSQDREQLNT